ncbi:hypothetical protein ACYU03_18780 [Pseudomonas sp. X10]
MEILLKEKTRGTVPTESRPARLQQSFNYLLSAGWTVKQRANTAPNRSLALRLGSLLP